MESIWRVIDAPQRRCAALFLRPRVYFCARSHQYYENRGTWQIRVASTKHLNIQRHFMAHRFTLTPSHRYSGSLWVEALENALRNHAASGLMRAVHPWAPDHRPDLALAAAVGRRCSGARARVQSRRWRRSSRHRELGTIPAHGDVGADWSLGFLTSWRGRDGGWRPCSAETCCCADAAHICDAKGFGIRPSWGRRVAARTRRGNGRREFW